MNTTIRMGVGNLVCLSPDSIVTVAEACNSIHAGRTFIRTWPGVRRTFGEWAWNGPRGTVYINSAELSRCLIGRVAEAAVPRGAA